MICPIKIEEGIIDPRSSPMGDFVIQATSEGYMQVVMRQGVHGERHRDHDDEWREQRAGEWPGTAHHGHERLGYVLRPDLPEDQVPTGARDLRAVHGGVHRADQRELVAARGNLRREQRVLGWLRRQRRVGVRHLEAQRRRHGLDGSSGVQRRHSLGRGGFALHAERLARRHRSDEAQRLPDPLRMAGRGDHQLRRDVAGWHLGHLPPDHGAE